MHLVPFGEYIPLRHSFPLFAKIAGELVPGDLRAGTEYTLFQIDSPPLRIAPLICFEDTDGDHTRRIRRAGGAAPGQYHERLLVRPLAGSEQHLANALFRAIENRRPLVRDANTGVTCIIDAEGRVLHALRNADGTPFLEGILFGTVDVPRDAGLTFYTQHGDWVIYGAVAVTVIAVGVMGAMGGMRK